MKKSIGSVSVTPRSFAVCGDRVVADLQRPLAERLVALVPVDPDDVAVERLPVEPVVGVGLVDRRPEPGLAVGVGDPPAGGERRVRDDVAVGQVERCSRERRGARPASAAATGTTVGPDRAGRLRSGARPVGGRCARVTGCLKSIDLPKRRGRGRRAEGRRGRRRRPARRASRRERSDARGRDAATAPRPGASAATCGHQRCHASPAIRMIPRPFSYAPSSPVRASDQLDVVRQRDRRRLVADDPLGPVERGPRRGRVGRRRAASAIGLVERGDDQRP